MKIVSLWRIIIAEWKIKFLLGGAITVLFWVGYFRLEQLSHGSVTQMPVSAVDRVIPFTPSAAFVYVSQFITVPLVVWLMTSRPQLLRCCRGLLLLMGGSFLVFYFWPTVISRPGIAPGQFFIYDLVVGADKSGNACPSLHAAFGIFTAGCAWEVFRGWRNGRWLIGASWVWMAAILASTLLIKQHVFLDLLAGGLLGFVSWWFVGRTSKIITAPENDSDSPQVSIKPPSSFGLKS
jgi:membrane-associated phospholipid phosphatase